MKSAIRSAQLLGLCLLTFVALNSQPANAENSAAQAAATSERVPLLFEANIGQTDSDVRFLARSNRYQVFLTQDSAVLKVVGPKSGAVVRTTLQGANRQPEMMGTDLQAAKTNYLLGPEENWKTGVSNFAGVQYQSVYPGVDLKYYSRERQLEYDFDIAPSADPSAISLIIAGAEKVSIAKDGALILATAAGEIRWEKPVAYQQNGSERTPVAASYRLHDNHVSFEVGAYDRSRTLVIDPVLVYGTFLGGSYTEQAVGIFADDAGFAYIAGSTLSPNFPTTPGAFDSKVNGQTASGSFFEAFVTKLSQDGSSLVWSTILGGNGPQNNTGATGFAVDNVGSVYVVGSTLDGIYDPSGFKYSAPTFPITAGAYNSDRVLNYRYYLAKLNNTGSALDFSTFLSKQPNIAPASVAVGLAGNVFVTGFYSQANGLTSAFPATPGAYQSSFKGLTDAFVMKFNTDGTSLLYATLVGGLDNDTAQQLVVDSSGNATIAGTTSSTDYPISVNGRRQKHAGGFITTLNSAGTGLLYSTVLDNITQINLKRDPAGYYYVGGAAASGLPTTANAFQKSFPASAIDPAVGFFSEIDPAGNLVYSSYLGGNPLNGNSEDTQVLIGSPTNVTLGGNRIADRFFPVTDRTYEQDDCSFLAKFNPQATTAKASLTYSGCTPVNRTNNSFNQGFRGFPTFVASQFYLNNNNELFVLNASGPTTSNAFQKTAPTKIDTSDPTWIGAYDLTKLDTGGVNVSAPIYSGPPFTPPVEYRVTGRSPQCAAGVAAIRVYTSPGVAAYTTLGATLDAYIPFPVNGTNYENFNTVVVVYDNCGKAFTKTIPILIQGPAKTATNPNVVSPTNGGVVTSPVHFVATATAAASCSKGVAATRIYTAPGVNAYTTNGGSLDTYLNLPTGTYNVVLQEFDNCGGVSKTPLTVTVE